MKAIVKATGELIDVLHYDDRYIRLDTDKDIWYVEKELDFENTPDYWEKLKHQYAGMAMQGILSNEDYCKVLLDGITEWSFAESVARASKDFATALVEKLKKEKHYDKERTA